ncbi:unnamed protein product [Tenebrio molitor]|nr:unnamed protein product [Tenebrio molitor]
MLFYSFFNNARRIKSLTDKTHTFFAIFFTKYEIKTLSDFENWVTQRLLDLTFVILH